MIHTGNQDHGSQIMRAAGSEFARVTMEVISRSENGICLGGAIYENYTGKGGSVVAHIAGFAPNWLNRDMLYIMFDYPFKQLDCKLIFCQIAAKNEHTRKFSKSLGFEEHLIIEDVFPDDDMVLIRMKREDCRFLNVKPRTIHSRRTSEDG